MGADLIKGPPQDQPLTTTGVGTKRRATRASAAQTEA